jgi:hypothetical protein
MAQAVMPGHKQVQDNIKHKAIQKLIQVFANRQIGRLTKEKKKTKL